MADLKWPVNSTQISTDIIPFKLDASATSLLWGDSQLSVVKNGTGDFTITVKNPGGFHPTFLGSGFTAATEDLTVTQKETASVQSCRLLITDGGVAADADVVGALLVIYSDDLV